MINPPGIYTKEFVQDLLLDFLHNEIEETDANDILARRQEELRLAHEERDAERAKAEAEYAAERAKLDAKNKAARQLRAEIKQAKREEELRFMAEQVALIVIKKLKEEGIV